MRWNVCVFSPHGQVSAKSIGKYLNEKDETEVGVAGGGAEAKLLPVPASQDPTQTPSLDDVTSTPVATASQSYMITSRGAGVSEWLEL